MVFNQKEKPSEGFDFRQHSRSVRNIGRRPPTTKNVTKPPTVKASTRFSANEAALTDIFGTSNQQLKKIPLSKTHPATPRKIEKLKKSTLKRNQKPSPSLIKKVATIDEDVLALGADTTPKTKCPYCHETLISINDNKPADNADRQLHATLPPILQVELDRIMEAQEKYHEERQHHQYTHDLPKRRFVSNMDQFRFCQLHTLELKVKPEGIRLGYPMDLDFTTLGTRVESLKSELEKVVNGELESHYRRMALVAYNDMGLHKARNAMGVMNRFEKTLPGYYGSKGASVIMNKINDMLLHTGFLTKEKTHPQLPLEYIQQVLVPETGWRLIQQDLVNKGPASDHTMEKAMEIMANSVDFGSKMYPADEEDPLHPVEPDHNGNRNGNDDDTDSSKDDGHGDEQTETFEYQSSEDGNVSIL